MKKTLTMLFILCSLFAYSQTAEQYFQKGIIEQEQLNYKEAIKNFDKAIKADIKKTYAYFNRASCEIALKDYKAALSDYSKTIELEPEFPKAYYGRASVFISLEKYAEALPDLDKTIALDKSVPNVLTLRGQIRAQMGNKTGACEDFHSAKEIGDGRADKYISQFCGNEQQEGESLLLHFPESENWKLGSNQENDKMTMMELIHSNETFDNWTELACMIAIKGVKGMQVDEAMRFNFTEAKSKAPKAFLTFIEKDEKAEYPWIIFSIESPYFKNDRNPESQLYYIVQGKDAMYSNFIAVKKAALTPEFKQKWVAFFKTGKVINK